MARRTVTGVLAAAVATAGTFTVAYPTGTTAGNFKNGKKHRLNVMQSTFEAPKGFTIAFGATVATVTWLGTTTIPAGSTFYLELDMLGESFPDSHNPDAKLLRTIGTEVLCVDLGSPVVAAAAFFRAAAAIGGAGALTLLQTTLDVPRTLTFTSSGNDTGVTFTITGKDEYNQTMVENVTGANAGVATGVKAFKTVTSISASGASAGTVSVGFSNVLGLPIFLRNTTFILREIQDNAVATAGTVVAGATATATATTGDVRGTYLPNAAPDGTRALQLLVVCPDPGYRGAPQFAG